MSAFPKTILIAPLFLGLCSCKKGEEGSIKMLINSPVGREAPSRRTASAIGKALIDVLASAEETIDLAIYGLRNQPDIIKALQEAKERGVQIRVVIDKTAKGDTYYSDTPALESLFAPVVSDQNVDIETLAKPERKPSQPMWPRPTGFSGPAQCVGYSLNERQAIVSVHASREEFKSEGHIMHNKFAVVDEKIVWTGSCNLSDSGTGGYNANVAVVVDSPSLAKTYSAEFDGMYENELFHHRKRIGESNQWIEFTSGERIKVAFSPQDKPYETLIKPLIDSAKESIDVAVFFFTNKYATADLIKAHLRGVRVRVILDATAATNGYTKHEILRAAGIPVKVENWGGKMHMKAAVFDGASLVIGSMNWTSAGDRDNDENTLVIKSSILAQQFETQYEELWQDIDDRWLNVAPDPESHDSRFSMTDKVDNDFDNLVDGDDPGWGDTPPALPPHKIVPLAEGYDLIKGNINSKGQRYYFRPTDQFYPKTKIDVAKGERWFPSTWEAEEAGWSRPSRW